MRSRVRRDSPRTLRCSASRGGPPAGRRARRCARTGSTVRRSRSGSTPPSLASDLSPTGPQAGLDRSSPTSSRSACSSTRDRRRAPARLDDRAHGGVPRRPTRQTSGCTDARRPDRVPGRGARGRGRKRARAGRPASRRLARPASGYFPLAIRLNERHGFHRERMHARPPELDARLVPGRTAPSLGRDRARDGSLASEQAATCRIGSPRRMRRSAPRSCSRTSSRTSAVPFLVAARRLGLPVVGYVASWDHTVGKGVISPYCRRYLVQNEVMRDDLRRYHGIAPSASTVTGWPQTDVFQRKRPRIRVRRAAARSGSIRRGRSCS